MALTKKDRETLLKDFKKVFATKEDLKQCATKEDLKQCATKEDLKQCATKEDLRKYATRDDLLEFKDDLIKRLEDLRTDKLMLISRNRDHEEKIENHETRIKLLEKKVLV